MTRWVEALGAGGRLKVPSGPPPTDPAVWAGALEELAARAAWELPGPAPAFALPAASWAAARVLVAAQGIASRALPAEQLEAGLSTPCPEPLTPSAAWSVDLTLRQLPRLLELARGFPDDDPVLLGLLRLARDWPLSSVGVAVELDPERLSPILAHPALRRLYADRVLIRRARDRLDVHAVRVAARAALGAHTDLCPTLAAALAEAAQETPDADRS